MRGVQSSTGEECEDWIPKEGWRAQSVEGHHKVLRLQNLTIWNSSSHNGDFAQVRILSINNLNINM